MGVGGRVAKKKYFNPREERGIFPPATHRPLPQEEIKGTGKAVYNNTRNKQ